MNDNRIWMYNIELILYRENDIIKQYIREVCLFERNRLQR